MSLSIPVAHDFTCGWCYIGIFQVRELEKEFGVTFDWKAYELWPVGLESGPSTPLPVEPANKPKTPSRMQLALAAQNVRIPKIERPGDVVTRNAHLAVEFIKESGDPTNFIEAVYQAYWERGEDIGELAILEQLATPFVANLGELRESIMSGEFESRIVKFDNDAYASGVYNLPTFWIGGERYAEQPIQVLRRVLAAQLELHGALR